MTNPNPNQPKPVDGGLQNPQNPIGTPAANPIRKPVEDEAAYWKRLLQEALYDNYRKRGFNHEGAVHFVRNDIDVAEQNRGKQKGEVR